MFKLLALVSSFSDFSENRNSTKCQCIVKSRTNKSNKKLHSDIIQKQISISDVGLEQRAAHSSGVHHFISEIYTCGPQPALTPVCFCVACSEQWQVAPIAAPVSYSGLFIWELGLVQLEWSLIFYSLCTILFQTHTHAFRSSVKVCLDYK